MAQEGWNVEASSDSIDQCQQQQNQNQNNDGVLLHCSNNSAVFGISDASMNLCTNCFSERQGGEIDPPFPPSDLASKAMRNKDLPSVCSEKSCVSSAKKLGVVSLASKEAGKGKVSIKWLLLQMQMYKELLFLHIQINVSLLRRSGRYLQMRPRLIQ